MADYQEYRRRVLHRRWRRRFMAAGLLFLLVLLGAVGVMWKHLHRDPAQTRQDTILQEITEDNTWNTLQYASTRPLTVQTLSTGTTTALDFRMAALPRTAPVEKSWFSQVSFVGDSLTQGMQMYDTGLPGAMFCAYRGVGPNAIVNGTSCKRADGVAEVPLDALTAQQPKAVYLLLGTNVLGTDSDVVMRPIEADVDRQMLADAVAKLSPRERDIITMRFGLGGSKELTQKEVADRLGISQSYISRLEKRIILRLRREMLRMS